MSGQRNVGGRMLHFLMMPHDAQIAALVRLNKSGMSDTTIATASGLAVEQVRRLLAEANEVRS